jgi:hypothetical protein
VRGPTLVAFLVVVALFAGCSVPTFLGGEGGPGDAAKDIVSGKRYPKLLLEVDHPAGAAPNEEALATLTQTIREVTGKTEVRVERSASIPSEPSKKYSFAEIRDLEKAHRSFHSSGDEAVLYVLYVAGGSADDSDDAQVLGAVYAGTSIVMFKGNVKANTGNGGPLNARPQEKFVERAVLVHEFGHAAGLVNLGAPMVRPHEDGAHGEAGRGHSASKDSVMYYTADTSALLATILTGGSDIVYQFDADDKADLRALRDS